MNVAHNSYRWCINSDCCDLKEMIDAQNGDVFKSDTFMICNIEWMIELYPNGDNLDNIGCFIVLLQPISIPRLWNKIIFCRRIKCQETECMNTGITYTINTNNTLSRSTGWMDETMSFKEFKEIINNENKITFIIIINVLNVFLINQHILNVFCIKYKLSKQEQMTFEWKIDNNLLNKFKSSHFGQIFESEIFNEMWCISCLPNSSNTEYGEMTVYLQLCSMPQNVDRLDIEYIFKCKEINIIQKESDTVYYQHQNSGPEQFVNIKQLNYLDFITISVDINILQIHYKQCIIDDDDDNDDNDKYKKALNDLIKYIKKPIPRNNRSTSKINELKKLIQKKYASKQVVIESDDEEEEKYFDEIIKYINNNNQIRKKGDIVIHCIGNNKIIKQNKALEIFIININKRNPALIGQKGLRSKIFIPNGTVIGEYFGREFLENEFDDIYNGTKEWIHINQYALSATIDVEMKHSKLSYYTNINFGTDEEDDGSDEIIKQEFNIVIDGLNINSKLKAMMIYMNDCRKDITMTEKTKQDEKYQNVELIKVFHNGWPKIFAIAIKNIYKNDELITFYGKSHVRWEQDNKRYQLNKQLIQQNIQQILDQHHIHDL